MAEQKKGKELEKKGDECLKTGLFQWSKDLAGAATHYDDAVKMYTGGGHWKEVCFVQRRRWGSSKS